MAIVVVDETEFDVVELAGPLYGLLYISVCRYLAVGRVGIGRAEIAGGAVYFADVLRQVPAVGVPCAVFLDGQRARGDILRGIPGNEPQAGVSGSGEVDAGNLQVAAVDVALVQRDTAVGGYLLRCAAAHVVVLAMHGGDGAVNRLAGEVRGAVFGIVAHSPDAGAGLHTGLVTIRIKSRR